MPILFAYSPVPIEPVGVIPDPTGLLPVAALLGGFAFLLWLIPTALLVWGFYWLIRLAVRHAEMDVERWRVAGRPRKVPGRGAAPPPRGFRGPRDW